MSEIATTTRIQRKRTKGWRAPPNTVIVTRPTKWGNPFKVESGGNTQTEAVRKFRDFLKYTESGKRLADVARRELKGKKLACFCALGKPCHADALVEAAEGRL